MHNTSVFIRGLSAHVCAIQSTTPHDTYLCVTVLLMIRHPAHVNVKNYSITLSVTLSFLTGPTFPAATDSGTQTSPMPPSVACQTGFLLKSSPWFSELPSGPTVTLTHGDLTENWYHSLTQLRNEALRLKSRYLQTLTHYGAAYLPQPPLNFPHRCPCCWRTTPQLCLFLSSPAGRQWSRAADQHWQTFGDGRDCGSFCCTVICLEQTQTDRELIIFHILFWIS